MGWTGWFSGIVLVALGCYLLFTGKVIATFNHYVQQPSAVGGTMLILLGGLILYISYSELSPFKGIRKKIESLFRNRK